MQGSRSPLAALALGLLAVAGCLRPEVPQPTRVAAVYPSGPELPANQLKLYLEFTGPMTTSSPYDYIRLIDTTTGAPVQAAFHQMRAGLWDPRGTRLTVVFDPGRIKRGLANHEAMGPPLRAGHSYRLEISPEWPDAAGRPLASAHAKSFRAVAADRRLPRLSDWRLSTPAVDTRDPVHLAFGEPLDAALLQRAFRLWDPDGRQVLFDLRPGRDEASCELVPTRPWATGRHRLEVDPTLEDLAGNNLERLFDTDTRVDSKPDAHTWLEFEPQQGTHRSLS